MGRKTCRRRVIVPMLPRSLRPALTRDQIQALAIAHNMNLADFKAGRATPEVMWQTAGGVLTWSYVAQALRMHQAAMVDQLKLMERVVKRFAETGRVEMLANECEMAARGVPLMDELAEAVDKATATAAVMWSEDRVNAMERQTREATEVPA